MRPLSARLLSGSEVYREVVLGWIPAARESVWIATANVKDVQVRHGEQFRSILAELSDLAGRGVELRLLHAELPSRAFRASFDRRKRLVRGGLALRICPRVHFKAVLVDRARLYLGSANLTGAGMGAKGEDRRNFELGFVTEDFDVIDRTTALFESVWNGAECGSCKLRRVCPDPIGAPVKSTSTSGSRTSGALRLGRSRRLDPAGGTDRR